jgi:hypothetical protein
MLACFEITQPLPKNSVNPQGQENQKDRRTAVQMALSNLERSGFVFHVCKNFSPSPNKQNNCHCFFDVYGDGVKGPLLD